MKKSSHSQASKLPRRQASIAPLIVSAVVFGQLVSAEAATVIRTGTVKVSGAVAINPGIPQTAPISGSVNVFYLSPFGGAFSNDQSVSTSATLKRTGNTAAISLTLPYAFIFESKNLASAKVSVTVSARANGSNTSARSQLSVPANGTTTPVKVRLAF